uniref:Uncharacterized protein n=1 Tax=Panagrellus redivivus TaxID=6233 RepID=A0A7E4UP99_PANRE
MLCIVALFLVFTISTTIAQWSGEMVHSKQFQVRIIADFTCHGVKHKSNYVDIMTPDFGPLDNDAIGNFFGDHMDIIARHPTKVNIHDKTTKWRFYIRVWDDCGGCSTYIGSEKRAIYDSPIIPEKYVFETRQDAVANPYKVKIELSQCKRIKLVG